ncbi:MAG: 5-methyltetrahydrofolate--homocysteine methyltransferase [Candidatus Omnitrophota bacterium]|nr:MAG: 5-methyltetrahydrofolate--homocysteine methyltransferase [Candidatus Omnitrophota bacterium]
MQKINSILKKRVLILDGATGTELQKLGMPQGVCPEMWCLQNPEKIKSIHFAYQRSGADLVYSPTFGANRIKLKQYGIDSVQNVNQQLVRLAKDAVGKTTLIAGGIGPTGEFIEPFGKLKFETAVEIFKEQALSLLKAGVDLFVIETMLDIQEARAALIAVKEITDKFTLVTMTYEKNQCTLSGTDPVTALITLQSLGADAVGCNCSTGPEQMLKLIAKMKPYACVPLVAKPNAGMPRILSGKTVFDMQPDKFAAFGRDFVNNGAVMLGGCCGTNPDHIVALKNAVSALTVTQPEKKSISALSSARKHKFIGSGEKLTVVGECINPTGKKTLQAELRLGKMSLVRSLANQQENSGADLLDVNAGVSGIDEKHTLKEMIKLLSVMSNLGLVIDSTDVDAVEAGLRIYPGRALINSISADKDKLEKLLSIAAKYGAMFIALPLDGRNIPKKFLGRKELILKIFEKAKKFGFTKDDFVVDGLIMTVSSLAFAGIETLKTIKWCSEEFRVGTICGLSNISFGLPERVWMNAAFLAMAQANGLTMVIANPLKKEIMYFKRAADVLLLKDKDAAAFISYFNENFSEPVKEQKDLSIDAQIFNAVLQGNREDIQSLIKHGLGSGLSADSIVQKIMIPAIEKVGDLFDQKQYFLPQLIASAEAMKIGFSFLEPQIKKSGHLKQKKTVVILATVKGDIHDIGKNIVGLMLDNYGFSVIDLGKDVSAEKIIAEIKQHKSAIVGLSALMTTTMVNMKEVIELAKKEGLNCRFIVGGAVVTKEYAHSIGAEYACDGVGAVRMAKTLER